MKNKYVSKTQFLEYSRKVFSSYITILTGMAKIFAFILKVFWFFEEAYWPCLLVSHQVNEILTLL
jgi:hypothetical protein